MGEVPIKITSSIDFDDLSLYGFNVSVDLDSGDVFIEREGREVVSVTRNPQTKKIEVKKRVNGELKTVLNELSCKIKKYSEKLKEKGFQSDELDEFLYEFICNNGCSSKEIKLYQYDAETRKSFWSFFNEYVKVRFKGNYEEALHKPELLEIEKTIISWDIEDEKEETVKKEFQDAQFFCYTREKKRDRK